MSFESLAGTQNYTPKLIATLDKIKNFKKQLDIAQEERKILKKATAYFAKNHHLTKNTKALLKLSKASYLPKL